jgi:hypothetical protein
MTHVRGSLDDGMSMKQSPAPCAEEMTLIGGTTAMQLNTQQMQSGLTTMLSSKSLAEQKHIGTHRKFEPEIDSAQDKCKM